MVLCGVFLYNFVCILGDFEGEVSSSRIIGWKLRVSVLEVFGFFVGGG